MTRSKAKNGVLASAVLVCGLVLAGCPDVRDDGHRDATLTYAISGTVSGAVTSGVTVTLSGTSSAATTTELLRRRGPWPTIDAVGYATLEREDWLNRHGLKGTIGRRSLDRRPTG